MSRRQPNTNPKKSEPVCSTSLIEQSCKELSDIRYELNDIRLSFEKIMNKIQRDKNRKKYNK